MASEWGGWGCQPRILTSPTARQVWVGVSARLVPALHEQGEASEHDTDSARMAVRIMLCSKSSVCVCLAKEAAARERAQATQRRRCTTRCTYVINNSCGRKITVTVVTAKFAPQKFKTCLRKQTKAGISSPAGESAVTFASPLGGGAARRKPREGVGRPRERTEV